MEIPPGVTEDRALLRRALGRDDFNRIAAKGYTHLLLSLDLTGQPPPTRTTTEPVRAWLDRTVPYAQVALAGRVAAFVLSGLAVADIATLDSADGTAQQLGPGAMLALLVAEPGEPTYLNMAAQRWPQMPVRDAVAWAIQHQGSVGWTFLDMIAAWDAVDLAHDGWLYAAAGLHPDEAAAGLGDGSLTAEAALAVAALRGAALPA